MNAHFLMSDNSISGQLKSGEKLPSTIILSQYIPSEYRMLSVIETCQHSPEFHSRPLQTYSP